MAGRATDNPYGVPSATTPPQEEDVSQPLTPATTPAAAGQAPATGTLNSQATTIGAGSQPPPPTTRTLSALLCSKGSNNLRDDAQVRTPMPGAFGEVSNNEDDFVPLPHSYDPNQTIVAPKPKHVGWLGTGITVSRGHHRRVQPRPQRLQSAGYPKIGDAVSHADRDKSMFDGDDEELEQRFTEDAPKGITNLIDINGSGAFDAGTEIYHPRRAQDNNEEDEEEYLSTEDEAEAAAAAAARKKTKGKRTTKEPFSRKNKRDTPSYIAPKGEADNEPTLLVMSDYNHRTRKGNVIDKIDYLFIESASAPPGFKSLYRTVMDTIHSLNQQLKEERIEGATLGGELDDREKDLANITEELTTVNEQLMESYSRVAELCDEQDALTTRLSKKQDTLTKYKEAYQSEWRKHEANLQLLEAARTEIASLKAGANNNNDDDDDDDGFPLRRKHGQPPREGPLLQSFAPYVPPPARPSPSPTPSDTGAAAEKSGLAAIAALLQNNRDRDRDPEVKRFSGTGKTPQEYRKWRMDVKDKVAQKSTAVKQLATMRKYLEGEAYSHVAYGFENEHWTSVDEIWEILNTHYDEISSRGTARAFMRSDAADFKDTKETVAAWISRFSSGLAPLKMDDEDMVFEAKQRLPAWWKDHVITGDDAGITWAQFCRKLRTIEQERGVLRMAATTTTTTRTNTTTRGSRGGRGGGSGRTATAGTTPKIYQEHGRTRAQRGVLMKMGVCFNCLEHGHTFDEGAPCRGNPPVGLSRKANVQKALTDAKVSLAAVRAVATESEQNEAEASSDTQAEN